MSCVTVRSPGEPKLKRVFEELPIASPNCKHHYNRIILFLWQKKHHFFTSLRKTEQNIFVPFGLATGVFEELPEDSGIVDIIKNVEKTTGFGRPGFDPYTMFATILYGFAVGSPTLRELENSCRYDLRFKYLMNEATPDHSSFSRFINQYIKEALQNPHL